MKIFPEILQFKSEYDNNKQLLREHQKTAVSHKPESIMINHDQYNTNNESDDGDSLNTRNDDSIPAIKNKNFNFRYCNKFIIFLSYIFIIQKFIIMQKFNRNVYILYSFFLSRYTFNLCIIRYCAFCIVIIEKI